MPAKTGKRKPALERYHIAFSRLMKVRREMEDAENKLRVFRREEMELAVEVGRLEERAMNDAKLTAREVGPGWKKVKP